MNGLTLLNGNSTTRSKLQTNSELKGGAPLAHLAIIEEGLVGLVNAAGEDLPQHQTHGLHWCCNGSLALPAQLEQEPARQE